MKTYSKGKIIECPLSDLNSDRLSLPISVWKSFCIQDKEKKIEDKWVYLHGKDVSLSYMLKHVVQPELLSHNVKEEVKNIITGKSPKASMFGFCLATYNRIEGKVSRGEDNYKTFTNIIQLDLDLKNEEECTAEYVEYVKKEVYNTALADYILFCGKSISRKGLYLFIEADSSERYKLEYAIDRSYDVLQSHFNFKHPKTLDKSSKDIYTRLRYYSPDTNAILNINAEIFSTVSAVKPKPIIHRSPVTTPNDLGTVNRYFKKHLEQYHTIRYEHGFHGSFMTFANACIHAGISPDYLKQFTSVKYKDLYYAEKKQTYLPELIRVIENASKKILK